MCNFHSSLCLSIPLSEAKSGSLALAIFTSVFCILCFTDFKQCQSASSEGKTQIWKDLLWNAETQRITLRDYVELWAGKWRPTDLWTLCNISNDCATVTRARTQGGVPACHWAPRANTGSFSLASPEVECGVAQCVCCPLAARVSHGTVPLGRDRSLSLLCTIGLMDLHRGACVHMDTFPWLLVIFPFRVLGMTGKSLLS